MKKLLKSISTSFLAMLLLATCNDDDTKPKANNESPTADFEINPQNPLKGQEVFFIDASTDSDGKVVKWLWNFGDNTTSTEQNPKHTFTQGASYDVILTVTDDQDAQGQYTLKIFVADPEVENQAPEASFTVADTIVLVGNNMAFTDASIDADGGVVSWTWDFGDNATSTEQHPSHAYQEEGIYTVKLSVADNREATTEYTRKIYIGGIKWSFPIGGKIESVSPAVADNGTVYMALSAKGGINNVHAVNPDGTQLWAYAAADIIRSSPAIAADGTMYTASYDDNLYAFDGTSGAVKWKYKLGDNAKYSSAAIAADGTVYIGSQKDKVHAINPDGTLKWEFSAGGDVNGSPAIGSNGTVYAAAVDGYLYALNAADGTQKWKIQFGAYVGGSLAIGSDGTIYISANRGSGDTETGVVMAVNPDGTQRWVYESLVKIDQGGAATGVDGTVYVGTKTPELLALDGATGTKKWSYTSTNLTGIGSSPAIDKYGNICFGDDSGIFTVLYPNGTLRFEFSLGVKIWSSPVMDDDGIIYIAADQEDATGMLYAIDVYSGGPANSSWPMKGKNRKHSGR